MPADTPPIPAEVRNALQEVWEQSRGWPQAVIERVWAAGVATGRAQAADPDHLLEIIRCWADYTGYSLLNRDLENLAARIVEGSTESPVRSHRSPKPEDPEEAAERAETVEGMQALQVQTRAWQED